MMSRIYLPLLGLGLLAANTVGFAAARVEPGNLILDTIPLPAAELMGRLDRVDGYLGAREATPLGWSPKGQLLIATRFGDAEQLHLVDHAGGERQQLTFLPGPVDQGAFSPDPSRFAYVYIADPGSDAKPQLYYQRMGDAAAKRLTDGKSTNGGAVWSNGGRELAFFSTARDGQSTDIDVVDPAAGALPRLVVTGDGAAWIPLDWSPDDRKLLVLKRVSRREANLYVVDLSSGQKREIDAAPLKTAVSAGKFSRDGQGVYYVSDRDAEFSKLRYFNLFSGEKSVISTAVNADVDDVAVSRDGHYLAYVSNEGGTSTLNLEDLRARQDLAPPRLPGPGVIDSLSFDADGKRLAFGFATATRPRDAFILDLDAGRLEAWTHSETGAAEASKIVTGRLAQVPTFDRLDGRARTLPVYVFEPPAPGPHPVLIMLHAGPGEQFQPTFDPWIQYLVTELGFAVAAPNIRGSSGYGKTYAGLDGGLSREDAIKDMGALIVWLGAQGFADPKRMVVSGSSYGGYLALATLVNYSDRLRAGIDVAGMTDFLSYLGGTLPAEQLQARAEYGDERDPETRAYLRRISPLTNADRILRPLLIVHGAKAASIPLHESEQLINRLRSHGGQVWFLQARNEGERFVRQDDRVACYRTIAEFLLTLD